jgi:hypothetical protein
MHFVSFEEALREAPFLSEATVIDRKAADIDNCIGATGRFHERLAANAVSRFRFWRRWIDEIR